MEIIQEVGSYAGFAAVVGLAVLSALYFSQARDLRRLREWAGRAPERTAEQAAAQAVSPEQAAQEAGRPAPSGAVRPIPAAKPGGPGAKPEPAKPGTPAVTPAGKPVAQPAAGAQAVPGAQPASRAEPAEGPKEGPAAAPPVPATAAANSDQAAAKGPAPATPAGAPARLGAPPGTTGGAPAGKPPPAALAGQPPQVPRPSVPGRPPAVPSRPGPVARSPAAAAASQSTAVLPARERFRHRQDERNLFSRLGGRYVALIVAGVIVLGGAAAFGISQIGGDDESASSESAPGDEPQAPINPSTVTVSVLNGTTVPGLAAQIGDEVESAGFQRGNVANALDQQRTTSVVLYAEGADREARLVARRLGIRAIEPVDPDSQALAGNASVVVIVGADQTQ